MPQPTEPPSQGPPLPRHLKGINQILPAALQETSCHQRKTTPLTTADVWFRSPTEKASEGDEEGLMVPETHVAGEARTRRTCQPAGSVASDGKQDTAAMLLAPGAPGAPTGQASPACSCLAPHRPPPTERAHRAHLRLEDTAWSPPSARSSPSHGYILIIQPPLPGELREGSRANPPGPGSSSSRLLCVQALSTSFWSASLSWATFRGCELLIDGVSRCYRQADPQVRGAPPVSADCLTSESP